MNLLNINTLVDLQNSVHHFYNHLKIPSVFLLSGPLGAGKTTFTRLFCESLQVQDRVHSPSFNLLNEYDGYYKDLSISIFHIDMYRLQNDKILNIDDLLDINSIMNGFLFFIEWFEIAPIDWKQWSQSIGANLIKITFTFTDNYQNRTLQYEYL